MSENQSTNSQENTDILELAIQDLSLAVNDRQHTGEPHPDLTGHGDLLQLRQQILEIRDFVLAIANGNLDFRATQKGYLAGALKTLQAHLKHLTWQTQMVSLGDYSQRVDFMGEFSGAFNHMVEQLKTTVQELEESRARFREMAITDALTGLYNRRHFFNLAETEITRALRYSLETSIIMLDLDFFKKVNDTYGHEAGDNVLAMTGQLLRQRLRSVDVAARYGGEEFVVMLPESGRKAAMAVAEKIHREIARCSVVAGGQSIKVTASFGVSHLPSSDEGCGDVQSLLKDLIRAADTALYKAKDAGRDQVKNSWSDETG